jgi:putative transposase
MVGRDSVEPRERAQFKKRRHPAKGVFIFLDRATIVFVTLCTKGRATQLANSNVHDALLHAWSKADLWMIGAYVIMPDHIHLFCSPTREDCVIETWITFWKREFRRQLGDAAPRFQSDSFHHRLRGEESYSEKWEYVRANPVRADLVNQSDDWPYQGVIHELRS